MTEQGQGKLWPIFNFYILIAIYNTYSSFTVYSEMNRLAEYGQRQNNGGLITNYFNFILDITMVQLI